MAIFKKYPNTWLGFKYLTVFCMFLAVCIQRVDPDFGWHLQAGRYISSHGIPTHDLYSYTASSFKWIDHEWAYDVLVATIFKLSYAKFFMAGIFASIWTLVIYLAVGQKSRASTLIVTTLAILPYAGVRPTIFTILFFLLLVKIASYKSWRTRLLIPLLFVIWANMHGGLIAGLAIMIYFAYRDLDFRWLGVILLSFLATLLNPYGINLYTEIVRTIFDSAVHAQIMEWASFKIYTPSLLYVALWLVLYVHGEYKTIVRFFKHPLTGTSRLSDNQMLGPIMLGLAMSATRNMPLFVVVTAKNIDDYLDKIKISLPNRYPKVNALLVSMLFLLLLSWFAVSFEQTFVTYVRDSGLVYPAEQVDMLKKIGCPGNIFNDYNYGGYLVWKLPEHKVYIDGRMPVWRDEMGKRYMDRYYDVLTDRKYQQAEFNRYNIKCAVLGNGNQQLIRYLRDDDRWKVRSITSSSILLVE